MVDSWIVVFIQYTCIYSVSDNQIFNSGVGFASHNLKDDHPPFQNQVILDYVYFIILKLPGQTVIMH